MCEIVSGRRLHNMPRKSTRNDRYNKDEYAVLLRKAKGEGRNQREFAAEAGISVPHMCKMLNGVFEVPPTQTTLQKIATVAVGGVTYAQLMEVCGYEITPEEKNFFPSIYAKNAASKKKNEPLKEFRNLPEGVHAELFDYQMHYLKSPSVSQIRLCRDLSTQLNDFVSRYKKQYEVFQTPFPVFLNDDDAKCLIPSICVVGNRENVQEEGYYGAPELVIDVIGHGNEQSTYGSKLFKYRENGVSEYIIVDPMRKIVFDYDFKNNNTEVNKLPCDLSVQMFNGLCRLKIRP